MGNSHDQVSAFRVGLYAALAAAGKTPEDLPQLVKAAATAKQALWWPLGAVAVPAAAGAVGLGLLGSLAKPLVTDLPASIGKTVGSATERVVNESGVDVVDDYKYKQLHGELAFQAADARRRIRARLEKLLARRSPDEILAAFEG